MGPPLRRPERRDHPSEARIVPKKAGYDIRSSRQKPLRTSSEREAWLAKMRLAVAQKEMFDATEADIAEMRAAIGDNGAFVKFSDANEALLFSVMLTLRRKLEIYGERVRSEQQRAGPLLSVLAKLSKAHDLLGVAADEMSEVSGTTVAEARQEINEVARSLLGTIRRIAAEPKVFDRRTIESRRKRDEAVTIANCLKGFKAVVRGVKAADWLDLEGRIVRYMSGKEIEPESLKRRRQRARAT
jgi:hypothetical protein